MIHNTFFIVIIALLIYFSPRSIYAQQISLSFDTPIQHIKIKPSKVVTTSYRFTNSGDPTTVKFKIIKIKQKDTLGNIEIAQLSKQEILFKINNENIDFNQPIFMRSKESKDISLSIFAPDKLILQDYSYALLAETDPQPTLEGSTNIRIKEGLGAYIFVTVTDKEWIEEKGAISLFAIKTRFTLPFSNMRLFIGNKNDTIPLYLSAENQSDTYLQAAGTIQLTQQKKNKKIPIESYSLPPQMIFAHTQRLLQTSFLCDDLNGKICEEPPSLLVKVKSIGFYNLTATLSFDGNKTFQYAHLNFLIIPFWELIAIFCTIIALCIIFLLLRNTKKA